MFIRVHRYQKKDEKISENNVMILNTDNIITVIDRGDFLELRDVTEAIYTISETLNEFYDMVHPGKPVPILCKNPKMIQAMIGGKERRNNVTT